MDAKKIGQYIAKKRKEKGLTQQALADQLMVTNKAVSKWETGSGIPDVAILKELASALNITVDELLSGESYDEKTDQETLFSSYIISKKDYRSYLKESMYQKRWVIALIVFIGIMLICGGYALNDVYRFVDRDFDIIGKIFMLIGFLMIIGLWIHNVMKLYRFKEKTIAYELRKNSILYQDEGREICYYMSQLVDYVEINDWIIFVKDKKLIWLKKQDRKALNQNCVNVTTSSYQKKAFFGIFVLWVIGFISLCLELGYHIVLKRFGFAFIYDAFEYVLLVSIMLCIIYIGLLLYKKISWLHAIMMFIIASLLSISVFIIGNYMSPQRVIYSLSPHFSSQLVLKQDKTTGEVTDYHYSYLCFVKSSSQFHASSISQFQPFWVTNDCVVVSYLNRDQIKDVFVGTYGDRGNGISYYNVIGSLSGDWEKVSQDDLDYEMSVENGIVTIIHDHLQEEFQVNDIKQNGTIAATLYHNNQPQYVLVMNENVTLNDNYLVKNDGHIQLILLDQKNTSVELFCTTYKEDASVQQAIDDQMEESAKKLINNMKDIIDQDPELKNYTSTYDIFKVETTSTDYLEVIKQVYLTDINRGDSSFQEEGQITKIKVPAGTIYDFYAEVEAKLTLTSASGDVSEGGYVPNYRIMQANGCYLVGRITYRMPGDVGLAPLSSPIEEDVSQDEGFHYIKNRQ